MTTAIYTLSDERVRYVGLTTQFPVKRLAQHIDQTFRTEKNTAKDEWITDMIHRGTMPTIEVIDYVPDHIACKRERYWIRQLQPDLNGEDITVQEGTTRYMTDDVYEWLSWQNNGWSREDDVPSAREIEKAISVPVSSAQRGRKRWIRENL